MKQEKNIVMRATRSLIKQCIEKNFLVAIPVYNEHKYVQDILVAVSNYAENILVVDDGSNDGAEKLLAECDYVNIITHQANEGYGKSLIDAFDFAQVNGFEWVITMDCDYQHQPACIPRFSAEIEKDDVDIISGSRYLQPRNQGTTKPPYERVAINRQITRILNEKLGLKLTDSFCGFKAYRTESLSNLDLTEKGYGLPLQLWIQAVRANLKIREIPVPLIYHDPKRRFSGLLEVPEYRMRYYMGVIQREFAKNGCKITARNSCS
jgi:glycosyltransferase involved in cell wall biosynthesis